MKQKKLKNKSPVIKHSIDVYWDNETKQYVGISRELNYSGMGNTIEDAVKNTNISVEMALEWCSENGTLEEVLEEAGYKLHEVDNEKVWDNGGYVASFPSKICA